VKLILVRHGQTDNNREHRAQGRADAPLNELGMKQAAALEFALSGEKIAAVYASPRRRTLDTARAIASPHDIKVMVEERLVEMDVGEFDEMPLAGLRDKYPEFLQRWLSPEGPYITMPGGSETLAEVQDRARQAIEDLVARHEGETVVAVSHNFVILATVTWLLNLSLNDFRRLRQSVAAITSAEISGDRVHVITLNDTCHLRGIE
jgi:broad specificity phosphatase PhoE